MKINQLYSTAEKENIDVLEYNFSDDKKGIYIDNLRTIGINKNLTDVTKKCVLAEELGHYYSCNATYSLFCTDEALMDRAEYRAKKWRYQTLVSPQKLKEAKELGLKYKYEIAEYLEVDEEVLDFYLNTK